jgi:phosphatidylethanolamine-binding protein (PEBP) family uncharacterized protein
MEFTSTAFKAKGTIPGVHSYHGGNISPPLPWWGKTVGARPSGAGPHRRAAPTIMFSNSMRSRSR